MIHRIRTYFIRRRFIRAAMRDHGWSRGRAELVVDAILHELPRVVAPKSLPNPILLEAIRRESFTQGYLRGRADERGTELAMVSNDDLLAQLPIADEAFAAYRAERTGKASA